MPLGHSRNIYVSESQPSINATHQVTEISVMIEAQLLLIMPRL